MAKQRQTARRHAKKAKVQRLGRSTRPSRTPRGRHRATRHTPDRPAVTLRPAPVQRRPAPAPPAPPERTIHDDALEVYERGVRAVQQKQFAEAARFLQAVIDAYPDEKELHERAQLYLNVCRRLAGPPDATPQTFTERLYAATLAINAGAYGDGLERLESLSGESPHNDHVHYMLAVVRSLRGELEAAWLHLQRAIELNAENRVLARQDADLEPLRRDPRFRQLVERPAPARRERRAAGSRSRTAR